MLCQRPPSIAIAREAIITQSQPVPIKRVATADIIGFGQDGVVVFRNSVNPLTTVVLEDYGYNAGWRVEKHVRLVGDTTGNHRSDIIAFGNEGVYVSINNGDNTFGPSNLALSDFGTDQGDWNNSKHIRYVSDLLKRGYVDIIGFGDAGIRVSLNNGDGTFAPAHLALNEFGYKASWRIDRHLRFLADTNGDGFPDVIAFGEEGVSVAVNNRNGTFRPGKTVVRDFGYTVGRWRIEKHVRTLADITGDGIGDIIGFGNTGVWVSISNGDGSFQPPKLTLTELGYNQGLRVERNPRFVADTTGDGRGDLVAFKDDGVYVAYNNGDGTFRTPKLVIGQFGYNHGWRVDKHPRFLADLSGNGAVDVIGFWDNDVWVSYNDGNGNFGSFKTLTTTFAHSGGKWAVDKTVRWVSNLFY